MTRFEIRCGAKSLPERVKETIKERDNRQAREFADIFREKTAFGDLTVSNAIEGLRIAIAESSSRLAVGESFTRSSGREPIPMAKELGEIVKFLELARDAARSRRW